MNLHPEATRQLVADRRAALAQAAVQARLADAARHRPGCPGMVARLAGWLRPAPSPPRPLPAAPRMTYPSST